MVLKLIDYCYAKQLLNEIGFKIYQGDKQILKPIRPIHSTEIVTTKLIKGEKLPEEEILKKIEYDGLKKLGYIIISVKVKNRWFRHQKVQYKLARKTFPGNIGGIPKQHQVIMSTLYKRIRLQGPNASPTGYGPWIDLGPKKKTKKITKSRYDFNYVKNNRKKIKNKILGREDYSDIEYIEIPELPVMLSTSGELVCIPQIEDEYVILVVGRRGTGKSYTTASISSRLYWHEGWHKGIIHLNDHHDQFHPWALPNMQQKEKTILQRIGNHPSPSPLVFLYPKTNTFSEDKMFGEKEGDISFFITLPLKEIIQDYTNYLKGYKPWELGKSGVLFRLMQKELLECKSFEDILNAVGTFEMENISEQVRKRTSMSPQSFTKIITTMDDLFRQEIIDTSTDIPSTWTLYDTKNNPEELYPFIALLKANLIPVIKTKDVHDKFYYPQYMKYIIDAIFNNQTRNKYFQENQICIYIVVDEITDLAAKNELWKVSAQSLINCATQGRPNRIGLLANTQDYTRIPDTIVNQSEYCFALQLKDDQAKKIGKDFELAKHQVDELKNLETFEMMALTKRSFVLYDSQGNRRETGPEEAIRGFSLPPLCQHTPPRR